MPTASHRPKSTGTGGASTASNETPVSTAEQPNPPPGGNTRASRPPRQATDQEAAAGSSGPEPRDKANGRDHPTESEHDHQHQKLKGTSAKRG